MDKRTDFPLEPEAENELNISDVGISGEKIEFDLPDVPTMTDDVTGEVFTPAPRAEDTTEVAAEKKPRRTRKKKTEDTPSDTASEKPKRTRKKKDEAAGGVEEKPKRTRKKKTDTDMAEEITEPAPEDYTEAILEPASENSLKADIPPVPENSSQISLTDIDTTPEPNASLDALPDTDDAVDVLLPEDLIDTDEDGEYAPTEVIIEELSLFDEPRVVDIIPEAMPDTPPEETAAEAVTEFILTREEKYDPEKPRRVDLIFDFIELFVFTLVAVLLATTFFFRHSIVEGDSMLSTLSGGDTLIISGAFYTPERGDIIVVEDYTTLLDKPIVKRVIGIAGDHIRVREEGIYLNGKLLDEPYVFTDMPNYTYNIYPNEVLIDAMKNNETFSIEFGQYYELIVPEGELFVLGDHRNNSTDSRVIGTVRCDAVLGKVLFRIYPFEEFGEVN